jgi:hypothetical protein
MPDTLRLTDASYMRRHDVHHVIQYLYAMQCVEIVGFSNIGKSALLQLLAQSAVWTQELGEAGQEFLPIYIDCNRMLDLSDQGFYELVLRCLQEGHHELADNTELAEAYRTLAAPSSDFQIPLSFNQGLNAVMRSTNRKLVLLFDEFDEPFSSIDSRVFLNLRAMRDRLADKLVYVTATGLPLTDQRTEDHCSEFCELFSHRRWHLAPLTHSDEERLIRRYIEAFEPPFVTADVDFICEWGGGHPRLLEGICRILDAALDAAESLGDESMDRWALHRDVINQLRSDSTLSLECEKIWGGCASEEQEELLALFQTGYQPNPTVIENLLRRHILLKINGQQVPFGRLLTEFVQRKVIGTASDESTLWVDIDSGEVVVNGKAVETLTNLEYRLMLLLFQNADKIVDKYEIVTNVWGNGYIDEVDDARIEKLVSRLRQKVEPEHGNPQFLTTVRGRGYRLVTG